MATLSAASRRNSNASSSSSSSVRTSLPGGYTSRISSLEEDSPPFSSDDSRHSTGDIKFDFTSDKSNGSSEMDKAENETDLSANECERPKLKSILKNIVSRSDTPPPATAIETVQLIHSENSSSVESADETTGLKSPAKPASIDKKNNLSASRPDNSRCSDTAINLSKNANYDKNNNKFSNSNVSKLSDTAKSKTSERLKMFEQLSSNSCTSKSKKETFSSNKANFQKTIAFWNRE